jgi:hypothetical protein
MTMSRSPAPSAAAERMRRYRRRKRAAGLKLERRWVSGEMRLAASWSNHRLLEARSLALHCLAAASIERRPELLEIARRNLANWRRARGGALPPALQEWEPILCRPWPEIAAIMTAPTEEGARLRQSSPFAGVLTPAQRRRVYEAFRA